MMLGLAVPAMNGYAGAEDADREVFEDVEEIFEEDSSFTNDDEALAAMEFYDSPDPME